jgi:hypothetical protein
MSPPCSWFGNVNTEYLHPSPSSKKPLVLGHGFKCLTYRYSMKASFEQNMPITKSKSVSGNCKGHAGPAALTVAAQLQPASYCQLGCARYSVRSKYKRTWREYLFPSKRIKQVLFACFSSNRISEFYMRNEYKWKQIFLSKQIFYLFRFKANILKQKWSKFF